MSKVIRISDETWARLQEHATAFRGSERGTPDKVIRALLDRADRFAWKPGDVQVEPPEDCTCGVICGDDFEAGVAVYTRVPAPDCPVHRGG